MRQVAILIVFGALAGAAWAAPSRTVPCAEMVSGHPAFHTCGSAVPDYRYRQVLDHVSVPGVFIPQTVRVDEGRWRYWSKAGLVVRSGSETVMVSVPAAWRGRAGITWGNGGNGVMDSLRIAGCGTDPDIANAYAGGFFLGPGRHAFRSASASAAGSETVRFGVGRRC